MRPGAALVVTTGALLTVANPALEACGDKLLSIARGIRLQQVYKTEHPASILFYVGDTSSVAPERREALVQMGILYMSLRQAGHRLHVAQTEAELTDALTTASFDFVLADSTDIATVAQGGAALSAPPAIFPVFYKPSRTEHAAALEKYEVVLATPAAVTEHLEAIDRAMRARTRPDRAGV